MGARHLRATASGGPSATNRPPPSPPSGPRSMSQSVSSSRICSVSRVGLVFHHAGLAVHLDFIQAVQRVRYSNSQCAAEIGNTERYGRGRKRD